MHSYELAKNIYFINNNIIVREVTEKINYNCSFANFYQQLEYLNNKYNKVFKITNIIEKESEKFKLYSGYDNIINVIEYYKQKYSNRTTIIKYCYNEQIIIDKFNEEIEKTFKEYFEMLANFKIIIEFVKQNRDNINFKSSIEKICETLINLGITGDFSKIVFENAMDFTKHALAITECLILIENTKTTENKAKPFSKMFSKTKKNRKKLL